MHCELTIRWFLEPWYHPSTTVQVGVAARASPVISAGWQQVTWRYANELQVVLVHPGAPKCYADTSSGCAVCGNVFNVRIVW